MVPDGVVCYFRDIDEMHELARDWEAEGLFKKIGEFKDLFIECRGEARNNALVLKGFLRACEIGRGAVVFLTCEGELAGALRSEQRLLSVCLLVGLPIERENSWLVQARLQVLETDKAGIREVLEWDALTRTYRVLQPWLHSSSKRQMIVFADGRFNNDKMNQLWQLLPEVRKQELSVVQGLEEIRRYFNRMKV